MPQQKASWHVKLERAEELTAQLKAETAEFLNATPRPWSVEGKHSPDQREFAFWAWTVHEPPQRFSVLAGEVVHHLRSSLDHILWSIATNNIGSPSPRLQFPIFSAREKYDQALKRGELKGLGSAALALIESLQPFTQPTPQDTVLAVVQELDNIDKHRLLMVFASAAQIGQSIRIGSAPGDLPKRETPPSIVGMSAPNWVKLESTPQKIFGIQFGDPSPETVASADLDVKLTFEKAGSSQASFPVVDGLEMLRAGVRDTIAKLEAAT